MIKELNKALALSRIINKPMYILPDYLTYLTNCFTHGIESFMRFSNIKMEQVDDGIKLNDFFFPFESSSVFEPRLTVEDGLGIIPIEGPIFNKSEGRIDQILGFSSYEEMKMAFDKAEEDPNVQIVVFRSDSPGGEAAGMVDFADYIYTFRGKKPIFAVIDDSAYSAAYGIISVVDTIYATRTSGMGSIGTIVRHADVSESDKQDGYVFTEIYAGDEKTLFSPHQPLSEKGKARYQEMVDEHYIDFVRSVARGRGVSDGTIIQTQARIFKGQGGVDAGLVDEIHSTDDSFSLIKSTIKKEVSKSMDLKEMQEKHPELYAQIVSQTTKTVTVDLTKDKTGMETEIADLKKDAAIKDTALDQANATILADAEAKVEVAAGKVWDEVLEKSELPDNLLAKIREGSKVVFKSFVTDGVFNVESFKVAITAELKDWEDRAGALKILGKGAGERDTDEEGNIDEKEDDAAVEAMWKVSNPPAYEKAAYVKTT